MQIDPRVAARHQKRKIYLRIALGTIPGILAGYLLSLAVHAWWIFPVAPTRKDMAPEFGPGEKLYIKRHFDPSKLSVGQIVLLPHPLAPELQLLRRVGGVAGDLVEMRSGVFYRNGQPLERARLHLPPERDFSHGENPLATDRSYAMPSTKIEPGQLFVLCDNDLDCNDSRHFGPLPIDLVIGIQDQ